mmetsp:Transcript_10730/g.16275  ORF Transcript_10730/g.16275 Transcript_10730/m.16275 type:complete len:466 (+) Transcript_10730:66-1463(+)
MTTRIRDFDFYRKIPKDLTETTSHGSVLSACAVLFMLVLFLAELMAFLTVTYETNMVIDQSLDPLLRINFNISVLDLPCEFAVIDVVDVLGTRTQNITKNVNKWHIDSSGSYRNYVGQNRKNDVRYDTHHPDIDVLHENGVHAVPISDNNFDEWISEHHYTFVNFYAPWCVWCQRLEPVWEAFAEHVEARGIRVSVVKVDCVENRNLCERNKVQAFPLLRLFKEGVAQLPDYRSDRTVDSLTAFVKTKITKGDYAALLEPVQQKALKEKDDMKSDHHPGCMLSGHLLVNRVPGNFHIEARSSKHNLNPYMSNMSHIVNHLSFGPVHTKSSLSAIESVPDDYFSVSSTIPIDNKGFVNYKLHQAFHHHLKAVPTTLELNGRHSRRDPSNIHTYQIIQSAQIMQYDENDVPEARFTYDISPMSIMIVKKSKQWYEFVTSICAVIGGTFTVVGLLSGVLSTIFKAKKV